MRSRSTWLIPAVLMAGLPLVISLTAAHAATTARSAAAKPTFTVLARPAATVRLPTGEQVRLTGARGHEQVLVEPAATSGPGRAIVTHRQGRQTFVMPVVAEAYLGRFLDPNLFDVTSLAAAAGKNRRLPVRVSYRGSAPALPGITLTAKGGGVARGYLTAKSSVAFGRALTAQWMRDAEAGFPQRTSLFRGVKKISADIPSTGTVSPKFPMHTLVIKAIGPNGKPQRFGSVNLINVDDGRKYIGFALIENGEARISVPKGNYSAEGHDFAFKKADQTSIVREVAINEYKVNGAGQTLTLDYRKATIEPSVVVPKPTAVTSWGFEWSRKDAKKTASFGSGYSFDSSSRLLLAPTGPAAIGTLRTTFGWNLAEPVATPAYTYTVAATDSQVPAKPQYTFTDAQLATLDAAYYGEGPRRTAGLARYPLFGDSGGGRFERVARGTRRTEYVGASGGTPVWVDSLISNYDANDPGFVDTEPRLLPAGSTSTIDWLKGPLAAAIPVQSDEGYCFGCRSGNTLSLGLVPFTDSTRTHRGSLMGDDSGPPVARFQLYRNGKRISDEKNTTGGSFTVPAGKATYKVVLDVDRRLMKPAQSTKSRTELTFSSAKGAGPALPPKSFCDGANCRVLPIVQAGLSLPLDLNGALPAGKSTVTLTVDQVQWASKSAITSAGLEIRSPGSGWTAVPLTAIGAGKYQGEVDNTTPAGTTIDVRFSGADKAGSAYRQTVLRAYTVAGS